MNPWLWLVIALVLGIVELSTVAFFALFLAAGCVGAAIASWSGANTLLQVGVLGVVAIGGAFGLRGPLRRRLSPSAQPALVSGVAGLIGQQGKVVKPVSGPHNPGVVYVHGEEWPAISFDDGELEPGQVVLVVELDRTRVVVTANVSVGID